MKTFLAPTDESVRALFARGILGPIVMLNLLRFRTIADYSDSPELAPLSPITGEAAYRLYMEATFPQLERSGGKVLFYGRGGQFLIGPVDERWDAAMLIQQESTTAFLAFASNRSYLSTLGHRTAALLDSRLLALQEGA